MQQPNFFSIERLKDYSNRCFPDRMRSILQRCSNIREMIRRRENHTHKCAGTTSDKVGSIFSHQREKSESHTLSDRQQGNLVLSFENRGNKERTHIKLSKDICHYILNGIVFIKVEHLSSVLNKVLDSKSRKKKRLFKVASQSNCNRTRTHNHFMN